METISISLFTWSLDLTDLADLADLAKSTALWSPLFFVEKNTRCR
jgi:hypothetical protein